jgi:hypothetical protein
MRIIRSAVLAISATLSLLGGVATTAHAYDSVRISGPVDGAGSDGPIDPDWPPDPPDPLSV